MNPMDSIQTPNSSKQPVFMKIKSNRNFVSSPRFAGSIGRLAALFLAAGLLTLACVRSAQAASSPPDLMTYQGFLVDATGTPLATNTPVNYPVVFRIYSAATGGSLLWSEQQVVTVDRGQFSVVLGEGTTPPGEQRPPFWQVFTNSTASDRYMGISVTVGATTTDILPRLRLVASPYAVLAANANRLVSTNNGFTFLSYNHAVNRAEVNTNLFVSGVLSGNGSGLTGITASQIPVLNATNLTTGTLSDNRLSTNVALRNAANTFSGNQVVNGGNVGIGTGGTTPGFPLSFATAVGDKVSLSGQSGPHFGFGVQSGLLQIHSDVSGSDIVFGYGSSSPFTETVRMKGTGNVGIGTNAPVERLHVVGNAIVTGGLKLGTNNLNVAVGDENLRIIRGRVASNGAILAGSGFIASRATLGAYRLDFGTAFSSMPVVTVNVMRAPEAIVSDMDVRDGVTDLCDFRTTRFNKATSTFEPIDAEFNFIAIGPR
jgi:hypothetical protein